MTRKISFSSRKRRKEQHSVQKTASHCEERTTKETSFSSRIGKKDDGGREKPLKNHRYSQFKFNSGNLKHHLKRETTETSRTGGDNFTDGNKERT